MLPTQLFNDEFASSVTVFWSTTTPDESSKSARPMPLTVFLSIFPPCILGAYMAYEGAALVGSIAIRMKRREPIIINRGTTRVFAILIHVFSGRGAKSWFATPFLFRASFFVDTFASDRKYRGILA
jgi:hypothetical protein